MGRSPLHALALALLMAVGAPSVARAMTCEDAARADAAPLRHPMVRGAQRVWNKVYGVSRAMTGYETRVRFLAAGAGDAKGAYPSNAMICEGSPPTIYVSWPLLSAVFERGTYPVDFLALVLAHELGHRLHDMTSAGTIRALPAAVTGAMREARADVRGAYLTSAAGYATRKLACDDCLDDYLAAEHHVRKSARFRRKSELQAVLREFDGFEALYEAALAVTFWSPQLASRVLDFADGQMKVLHAPVAEFKVLRSVVELAAAAREQRAWLFDLHRAKLGADRHKALASSLRCSVVYPEHTALRDEFAGARAPAEGLRKGRGRPGRDRLAHAEALLTEAAGLGAGELVVNSGLACVAFYRGDTEGLKRYAERAARAVPKTAPKAVREAVEANLALAGFFRFLDANPPPKLRAKAAPTWRAALKRAAPTFGDYDALEDVAGELAREVHVTAAVEGAPAAPSTAGHKAHKAHKRRRKPKRRRCKAPRRSKVEVPARAPRIPPAPRAGQCPCGWSPVSVMTQAPAEAPDEEPFGITTCLPAGWNTGQRYVHVRLPGDDDGAPVDLRLLMVDDLPAPLRALGTWEAACPDGMTRKGTSDQGSVAWWTRCEPLGLERGVVFTDGKCKVRRAVQVEAR